MAKRFFEGIEHTANYALFRPTPPASLVRRVIAFQDKAVTNTSERREKVAVDVGCGSGQSTRVLSPFFSRVVGIDVSPAQVQVAKDQANADKIQYRVAGAESLPFENDSVDLVTICQAVHWLDIPAFYKEADRVLTPKSGVLAVYGYHLSGPSPSVKNHQKLTSLRDKIFRDVTGKYWSPERRHVDAGYTTIPPIPYPNSERDDSHYSEVAASLQDLAGYVATWSGFQAFKKAEGDQAANEVITNFLKESKEVLGTEQSHSAKDIPLQLRTCYFLLLGRKP